MKVFNYVIKDEIGIHARPAGMLVKEAKEFSSTITIEANGKKADLTKLMMLLSLGVKKGAEVTITAEGADEDAAIAAMETIFKETL
jgi:phosphocarrier protein